MVEGRDTWKGLSRIAALLVLFALLGPLTIREIALPGVLHVGTGVSTFFEQYRRHEPIFLALMAVFATGVAVAARRARPNDSSLEPTWRDVSQWRLGWLAAACVFVFAVTAAGTWGVMHTLPFSMDEYSAVFQAKVFASGHLVATLPDAWREFAAPLTPIFVAYDPRQNAWMSQYLPMYSALRAPFVVLGADHFVNPALAALSLPLVYACARRLWPAEQWRAWLAAGFLASSSQLVFMSMTAYAMPAHLVANLLWLYAFLRNDRGGWIAAPIIGAVALGIHNPVPHALFVAPFLLAIVLNRRWGWAAYFAAVYVAGIALWFSWARSVQFAGQGSTFIELFRLPSLLMVAVQELSLTVVLSWQTPVLAITLLWIAFAWRSLSSLERLLAISCAGSFLFFILFPSTQGHGWGYRYTYPVLGNMALLGVAGIASLREALGDVFVRRLLVASGLATVLVQWPVRAWQIEHYIRPFAQAHEYIAHLDADVVIVDPTTSWYGIDLVRNDPFLVQKPQILSAFALRPELRQELAVRFGDRVHLVQPGELAQFGVPTYPSRFRRPVWPPDPVTLGSTR